MTDSESLASLIALLEETGKAHNQAFRETDGADPEWPLWYARHLHERIGKQLGRVFTRSELVYHLIAAEREREASDPELGWPRAYAQYFLRQAR